MVEKKRRLFDVRKPKFPNDAYKRSKKRRLLPVPGSNGKKKMLVKVKYAAWKMDDQFQVHMLEFTSYNFFRKFHACATFEPDL